jgi:hypothetical protein
MSDHQPLSPEAVDVLLSAELDGDLEDAARDLGLSASEARVQLDATPGVDARRVALTRARDLIADRPPLEPPVAEQLVARAMARDDLTTARERRRRRERQWRVLVAAGSVAAAIAVIVGVSSMATSSNNEAKSASRALPTTPPAHSEAATDAQAPAAEAGKQPDLGDVTDAPAMRARAQRLLSKYKGANFDGATASTTKRVAPSARSNALNDSTLKSAVPACGSTAAGHYDLSSPPALIATGTASGAPVVILIYGGAGDPYADVIRVSDCTLVRRQPLG